MLSTIGQRGWLLAILQLLLFSSYATSESLPIQQLRSQLVTAAPGAAFQLPAGRWTVDKPLLLPPSVALRGAGMDTTTLLLNRDLSANFKYGFVIAPKAQAEGAYVGQLTIDGGRTPTAASSLTLAANIGGGLSVGSSWTVEDVRFTNLNYFKLWARNVTRVVVRGLLFEDLEGTFSGDNDNIGGGRIDTMTIDACTVRPSARGNGLDLMRSRGLTITNCQFLGSPTQPHNVYLEAVTDSLVAGNRLEYSSISLQSDAGYSDTIGGQAGNPRGNTVQANTVTSPIVQGISIRYDNGTVGGGNRLLDNVVTGAGVSGIATFAIAAGLIDTPDTVAGNTIVDPFRRGTDKEWNTGYGVTKSAGITLGAGPVVAGGNTITSVNTLNATTALYSGTQIGLRSSRKIAVAVQWTADDAVSGASVARFFQPI